jgi:Ca2+-binding EF-hand superfamily protein
LKRRYCTAATVDVNGEIEPDEIDESSRRYIRFIDTNKDGRVSKEELSQISGR